MTAYNESEQRGADLFDGNAKCGFCHTTKGINGDDSPALLTDFSYDNLGVPPNPQISDNPIADAGLLRTPLLHQKIIEYLDKVIVQVPDSVINEVDMLLEKTK